VQRSFKIEQDSPVSDKRFFSKQDQKRRKGISKHFFSYIKDQCRTGYCGVVSLEKSFSIEFDAKLERAELSGRDSEDVA
jgi:hypothetical protein